LVADLLNDEHAAAQGSGLSEGDWVTLGAREVDDLAVAVRHLRGTGAVSTIGLWGRSMGAVTALLYAQRDPSIAGVVRHWTGYEEVPQGQGLDVGWGESC
jgi:dienelactone hydrolase